MDMEDTADAALTLSTLPLDVLAYICSFLSTFELAWLMATSTNMASIVLGIGASKPDHDLPTCPADGPLCGVYTSQYVDAANEPCHRAWRCVHPLTPGPRRMYARRPAPLNQARVNLPLSVPRGAWCRPRPPFDQLVADLVMSYALVGCGRMRPFLPVAAAILSEPLPPGTLVCVRQRGFHAVATYADVFAHMENIENASAKPNPYGWWREFEEAMKYTGPTNVTAHLDSTGSIVITLNP